MDKNLSIKDERWSKDEALVYEVNIKDTLTPNSVYLTIRNSTDYGFSNLFLFIKTSFPDHSVARDTLECILANPDGKWIGKGLSRLKESQVLLKKNVRFHKKGLYRFEIIQGMRTEPLEGIADVGMRIVRQ